MCTVGGATMSGNAAAPYLASIGLLAPPPAVAASDSAADASVSLTADASAPSSTAADAVSLLGVLHKQYGRMHDEMQAYSQHQLEAKERALAESELRTGTTLARAQDDRIALERTHSEELQMHRRATAVALRSLHAELEALRSIHTQELAAVRRAAEEEQARLRKWCQAQLDAVESNRDALLGQLTERRDDAVTAGDTQLAKVVAKHREQQAELRQLLAEESERLAAARAEVLAVSVAAGNERLVMHHELANMRRRAASSAEASSQAAREEKLESEQREAALQRALRAAGASRKSARHSRGLATAAQRGDR